MSVELLDVAAPVVLGNSCLEVAAADEDSVAAADCQVCGGRKSVACDWPIG